MSKKQIFKDYLEHNEVLVVDKNTSSRNRLLKIMYDLGSKRHMIHAVGTFAEAQEIINTKRIGIVLSDYMIGGGSGFDLFKYIREKDPTNKKLCLVLVTSNISQTAVAKAAEEDVDSFVIKPYTIQSIQENLLTTVATKIQPSEYALKIEEAKTVMSAGKYDEAIEILKVAMKLHPRPSLALFYIGQAEYLKNHVNEAQGSYARGLSFNNIHYKCLLGLYEIFMREAKFNEAYQVVRKIARYFPANPDRLTQIVRLAVQTENYQDMQFYYEVFTSLEERTTALVNYIGAGMYVSGKYSLMNNDFPAAIQYFDNIAVSCSEFTKFVRAMITLLVENNKVEDASKYLSRFPAGSRDKEDFMVSDFLIFASKAEDKNLIVKKSLDLYNLNVKDFNCMKIMVSAMEACEFKSEKITQFKQEIEKLWPEKVEAVSA